MQHWQRGLKGKDVGVNTGAPGEIKIGWNTEGVPVTDLCEANEGPGLEWSESGISGNFRSV